MTSQGIFVLWLVGLGYFSWIIQLTRQRKLYIGYAVLWIFWIVLGLLLITIPPLLDIVTQLLGAQFPVSALTLLAFALLFGMQIYVLSQLSILSRRVTMIAQSIALRELEQQNSASDTTYN